MKPIAKRISETPAKSFGMFARAAAASPNRDLIHLELGRPVHDTPDVIKEGAIQAIRDGKVHYSDLRGELPLRAALARKLAEFNDMRVDADQILVTNGLTQASFAAIFALVDPGDDVLLLEPYYPQHLGKIELAGGRVITASMDRNDDFRLRGDLIEAALTERTKMIVLINPCNPTGRVFTRKELEEVAEVARRHDLFVLSDEVYEAITFDGHEHVSIASLPGMAERTISNFAFTKAYSMDGWRLGYAVAAPDIVAAMMKITTNENTHVNTFIQYGALAAIEKGGSALRAMLDDDRRRRDALVAGLNAIPEIECALPEGTIYAFPDITKTGRGSQQLAEDLFEKTGVVVEAGSFYGAAGEGHLRICFGSQQLARLEEAVDRMSDYFAKIGVGRNSDSM